MKSYNIYSEYGIHTIKVTIQCEEYIGSFEEKITGSCLGRDMLDFNFECYDIYELSALKKNNIDCDVDREDITIWNKEHTDYLVLDYFSDTFNDMIVAIEIVDYRECEQE